MRNVQEILVSLLLTIDGKRNYVFASKGCHWLLYFHSPYPGYIQISQEFDQHPFSKHMDSKHMESRWEAINDSFAVRLSVISMAPEPIFSSFTN